MKLINGKKIADKILLDLKKEIKEKGLNPCLAAVLVGRNPASRLYLRLKEEAASEIGVRIKKFVFSAGISEKELISSIKKFNQDKKIHGILVQLPLPKAICPDKIIPVINPAKDVDGFRKDSKFVSPFISAIWLALKDSRESFGNKKIVALVSSDIFGRSLREFFRKQDLKLNYYTDLTRALLSIKKADVIITALGLPNYIKENMIKKGVILVDGGITKKGRKISGDVDRESVEKKAKWLSPVPGGIGPITVACLLKNIVSAAKI